MMKPKDRRMHRITRDALFAKLKELGITTVLGLRDAFGLTGRQFEQDRPRAWSFNQSLAELERGGWIEKFGKFIRLRG